GRFGLDTQFLIQIRGLRHSRQPFRTLLVNKAGYLMSPIRNQTFRYRPVLGIQNGKAASLHLGTRN
ncbi:MAG: hypothetical protein CL949_15210, partial [Erythrobacter sp.]|nr:hypothetical protein [Erythrobacter sp.]